MKKMFVGFIAAFIILFSSIAAQASVIVIQNSTGSTIFYLYMSSSDTSDWEEDILGTDVLSNGETLRVSLTGSYREFDLMAQFEDESTMSWFNFPGTVTQITLRGNGTAEYQ